MVREIKQLGEEILKEISELVIADSEYIQSVIGDLTDTLRETGGVGIAAPQIGVPLRIIVMEVKKNRRYPGRSDFPLTVLINPEYQILENTEEIDYEGCLSVPGMRGLVKRHQKIEVRYIDAEMIRRTLTLEGFPARIVQHELDHLNGMSFLNRVEDNKDLVSNDYYFSDIQPLEILKKEGEVSIQKFSKNFFVKILDLENKKLRIRLSKRIKKEEVLETLAFFDFSEGAEGKFEKEGIKVNYFEKSNGLQILK